MASLMASVALTIDAMLPALGIIGDDLGVADPNKAQYVLVYMFAGMAMGQLVCGPLSDALGRKRLLYIGLAIYALGSLVSMFAGSMPMMLAGRFIQGIGAAGPYVSSIAIVRDRFKGDEMGRVMSLIMMIFIFVPAIAPALGQLVMFVASWRWIFGIFFFFALTIFLVTRFYLPETLPPEKRIPFSPGNIGRGFREIFTHPVTAGYMVCMGLTFGGFTGYLNSTRQLFQETFQTGDMFSVWFGCLALVFGLSSMLNARIVRHVGGKRLVRVAAASLVITSALFITFTHFYGLSFPAFVAYIATLYFAVALMFGNLNALAMEPMGHIAGIAAAVIGSSSSLLSLSLGTFIGQMYDGTPVPVATGFLVLPCISLAIMRWITQKQARMAEIPVAAPEEAAQGEA